MMAAPQVNHTTILQLPRHVLLLPSLLGAPPPPFLPVRPHVGRMTPPSPRFNRILCITSQHRYSQFPSISIALKLLKLIIIPEPSEEHQQRVFTCSPRRHRRGQHHRHSREGGGHAAYGRTAGEHQAAHACRAQTHHRPGPSPPPRGMLTHLHKRYPHNVACPRTRIYGARTPSLACEGAFLPWLASNPFAL